MSYEAAYAKGIEDFYAGNVMPPGDMPEDELKFWHKGNAVAKEYNSK